jgi:predicted AAA+ superfamily ATPase
MERFIKTELLQWFNGESRLPLILKGARQVGKTYAVREFAKENCKGFHEINFEEDEKLREIFDGKLDPEDIVEELSVRLRKTIKEEDLIFFDEVQLCPRCLTSLKYFAERRPKQPIIAAGSLLGLTLSEESFPVGKVEYQWMGPLSFEEFLLGTGDEIGLEVLNKARRQKTLSTIGHDHLWNQLKRFYITGGLPRPVVELKNKDSEGQVSQMKAVRKIQSALLRDYHSDFAKHSGDTNAMHISAVFSNVPLQLAAHEDRSTEKYKFSHAELGSNRGLKRLQLPIDWLVKAGLHYRVRIANQAFFPLEVYSKENQFKLYVFDVGILGAQLRLPPEKIVTEDYGRFKGYFAETLALQGLVKDDQSVPYCWTEGSAEIEFLISREDQLIPVEVKSGRHTQAKSLASYIKRYSPKSAVKLHSGMIGYDAKNKIHTLPLYLAWDLMGMDL